MSPTKPKASRTKEIIKIRMTINEIENKETTEKKSLKPKLSFMKDQQN